MTTKDINTTIDDAATKAKALVAKATEKSEEVATKGGDVVSDAAKGTERGGHRLQEAAEKAGDAVKEAAAKVAHAAEETAQKVAHAAKQVATKIEHRVEEHRKP